MPQALLLLVAMSFLITLVPGTGERRQTYVDSVNGSDSNSGLRINEAKQTFAGITAIQRNGDQVNLVAGSLWREQFTPVKNDLLITSTGWVTIDGRDFVTTGWTQPDAVTYPHVWSRTWVRAGATTTSAEYTGYWEAGARTTQRTSLALLEAGSNGDWHTTGITLQTSTISIRAAADPNTDGIERMLTKRAYGINLHRTTNASAPTTSRIIGRQIEIIGCYGHYNALTMGRGTVDGILLREGTAHHSVGEAYRMSDVCMIEQHPGEAASCIAAYTGSPSDFPAGLSLDRCLAVFPTGSSRVPNTSAYYSHGVSTVPSFNVNQCMAAGADFCNCDAFYQYVRGGYCLDWPARAVTFGGAFTLNSVVEYFVARETTTSPQSASNCCFFSGSTMAGGATVSNCYARVLSGGFVNQSSSSPAKHYYSNCAYYGASIPFTGGLPDIRYCVLHGTGRSYHSMQSGATGDYNIFCFGVTTTVPQFQINGTVGGISVPQALGQELNSVYVLQSEQVSGNGIALWQGIADGTNAGPTDGDWRINPSAKVYKADGSSLTGKFADGVTPITLAGPQGYWNYNSRSIISGPMTAWPTLPSNITELRTYCAAPSSWNFYP